MSSSSSFQELITTHTAADVEAQLLGEDAVIAEQFCYNNYDNYHNDIMDMDNVYDAQVLLDTSKHRYKLKEVEC